VPGDVAARPFKEVCTMIAHTFQEALSTQWIKAHLSNPTLDLMGHITRRRYHALTRIGAGLEKCLCFSYPLKQMYDDAIVFTSEALRHLDAVVATCCNTTILLSAEELS
jgi:hypothetical protein